MFSLACTTKRSLYRWESDGQLTHTTGWTIDSYNHLIICGFRQQLLPIEFFHACTLLDIFFQFSCWTRSVPKILIIHNHFMFLFYNNFFLYFSYSDNNLCVFLLLLQIGNLYPLTISCGRSRLSPWCPVYLCI